MTSPPRGSISRTCEKLLQVLHRLVSTGNTVIVIEHNLDVIKTADWIIDLGPEGGARGGRIVAEGTPEAIAEAVGSATGEYLSRTLRGEPIVPLSGTTFRASRASAGSERARDRGGDAGASGFTRAAVASEGTAARRPKRSASTAAPGIDP